MTTETVQPWRPPDTLANRIVLIRSSLGLSQREACLKTGITMGAWQGMEDGRSPRDLDGKVAQIAETLGVDRDWLMWGGPLAPPRPRGPIRRPRGDENADTPEVPNEVTGEYLRLRAA